MPVPTLTPAERQELEGYLADAKKAYHQIMLGQQAVQIRDQNGETITYGQAKAGELAGYIASLQGQLGIATSRAVRPLSVFMGR